MAKYDESSIERHAGLAGVRKKPTMYVGPMDQEGLWTIWREPGDNGVDRALANQNDLVHLVADTKGYWVLDNGPGIPVGKKEFEDERGRKEKLSTFYVVTGLTHAGGNFSDNGEASRGTHGIGLKATNALSNLFKAWTYRDGKWWYIEYAKGKLVKDVVQVAKPPKLPHGLKRNKGTIIYFEPDYPMFSKGVKMDMVSAQGWAELTSYLVKGLTVSVTNIKGKTVTYKTKNGPIDFITKRLGEEKAESLGKFFTYSSKEMDVAMSFSTAEGSNNLWGYTNGLRNTDGGEHVDALTRAMYASLKPYMGKKKKGQDAPFKADDLLEGLVGLINYKIAAPKFSNQVKSKLLDDRVKPVATPQLEKAFKEFWDKNKSFAKKVVANATALRAKTQDFLKDKKLIRNVNGAKKNLATKLAGISGKTPVEKRELFLVEGDSAAGTAKRARFKDFQAVYPLRGKPLNVMEAKKEKVNANAELANILAAIGVDLSGKKHDIGYGKIIFLTDPDVDGRHINCLLLAFFWKYMPYLFKDGRIYVLRSPEYNAWHRGQVYFGMTKESVYKQAGTQKLDIQHIKGWGEIQDVDMQPIAFDPDVRRLYRVLPPKDKQGKINFEALMGNDAAYRKQLLGVD